MGLLRLRALTGRRDTSQASSSSSAVGRQGGEGAERHRNGAAVRRSKTSPLYSFLLKETGLGETSFAKTQTLLHYVKKEFKHHGVELRGPCASLSSAGCRGKYSSNVQRDILRKVIKNDPDQVEIDWISVPVQKQRGPNGVENRKLPVVLPHNLVDLLPPIDESAIKEYWDHLSKYNSPLAKISPDKNHYPLWIWGDEAQFRENGDEIMLISMGAVLDNRKHSIESCYPLSICRSELKAGFPTTRAILEAVVQSLDSLYRDGAVVPGGKHVHFAISEIKGDWKWQVEWLQLSCYYLCTSICHCCRAKVPNYVTAPSRLDVEFRHNTESFLAECCKGGELSSPLLKLPAFQVEMIRWDGMHTVNLGTDLWVCGSVLKKLMEYDVFGDPETLDEADRLLIAYDRFRAWCRANKVEHSMPKFRPWRLRSKQHPWPELQSKAWNARCVLAWLCDEVVSLANSDRFRDDPWMPLLASCTWHLAEWHRNTELLGRYLTPDQAMGLQKHLDGCLTCYLVLSNKAIAAQELLFPCRPKLHAHQEIAYTQRMDGKRVTISLQMMSRPVR